MPMLSTLIAVAAAAIFAQAPAPRVEQVDLMPPAPQQQQPPPAQQPSPAPEAAQQQPPQAPAPSVAESAAVPLRSEARSSTQRVAAFWFVLPGGTP